MKKYVKNQFFHGIMFHHFHDKNKHYKGQGSISANLLFKMIKSAYFCLQNYNHTARVKDMIRELGWVTLEKRLMKNRLTQMCKIKYNLPDNKWKKYLR